MRVLSQFYVVIVLLTTSMPCVQSAEQAEDPSLVPLLEHDGEPAIRIRVFGDFNLDGVRDIAVSESMRNVSQNGLMLTIFLCDSLGNYAEYGTFYGFPENLSKVERDGRSTRLWTRGHVSATESVIGYKIMTDSGFIDGDRMTVFGGDGGGAISNSVQSAIISNPAVRLVVERYRIVEGELELLDY